MGIREIIKESFIEGYASGNLGLSSILICILSTSIIAAYIYMLYKNITALYKFFSF